MNKKIILYILVNCILIGIVAAVSVILHTEIRYFAALYMFFPFIATLVAAVKYRIPAADLGLKISIGPWYAAAWILPFFLAVLSILISLMMGPGMSFSPGMEGLERFGIAPDALPSNGGLSVCGWIGRIFLAFAGGITVNAIFALGEEIGWRGLLYKELRGLGFWKSSLAAGLLWGVWHAPVILSGYNYPNHPEIGVFMMTAFCILLSPLMQFLREKTGSVIPPAVFHGTINAFAGYTVILIKGGNDLLTGMTGLSGMIVFLLMDGLLFVYMRTGKADGEGNREV
ncbi:MAG: CPBP family intramembrane metalloprotease [Spirochaetales bacterium]|nr:CPBP family intramembrane metalloprotease [Spirochaetales bacterium]